MHASAEILARLAPKIVSLDSQTSGYGDLKPLDLAAALSGLPAGPYALARVAWVDDVAAWRGLVKEIKIRLRVKPDWEGVIALAAAEYCWPPSCRECFGRGRSRKKSTTGSVRPVTARATGGCP